MKKVWIQVDDETAADLENDRLMKRCSCLTKTDFARTLIEAGLEDMKGPNRLLLDRNKAIKTEEERIDYLVQQKYKIGLKLMNSKGYQ